MIKFLCRWERQRDARAGILEDRHIDDFIHFLREDRGEITLRSSVNHVGQYFLAVFSDDIEFEQFLQSVRDRGGVAIVARSIDDVMAGLPIQDAPIP